MRSHHQITSHEITRSHHELTRPRQSLHHEACKNIAFLYPLPSHHYLVFFLFLFLSSFSSPLFLPFLQLVIGRFAVSLASVFVRCRQGEWRPGKKTGFGVTFTHVSDTYHLLHQIDMASECMCVGVRMWVGEWVSG